MAREVWQRTLECANEFLLGAYQNRMNDSVDDAMVVIQEASATIVKVSHQLSGYEGSQKEVASALKEISDRVTRLESAGVSGAQQSAQQKVKPPLFIKVLRYYIISPKGGWRWGGLGNLVEGLGLNFSVYFSVSGSDMRTS